jgi:hypothetical protein
MLLLSSIRRLKRSEHALAVIDAESAFESTVAAILVEQLKSQARSASEIEALLAPRGRFHMLQQRLVELDRIAASKHFLGSNAESVWRTDLSALRNRVVHEGLRDVTFDVAKKAVTAALRAVDAVQGLAPAFERQLNWTGSAVDLPHIEQSAGRISRLFEA